MSNDIEISMKTTADTSGAKAAEEAIKGVGKAGEETSSASASNSEMLKAAGEEHAAAMAKAREATDELFEGLGKISEGLEEVAKAGEEANEQGGELEENVRKITRAQMMRSIADLAGNIGQIGAKFHDASGEMEEFDASAAKALRETGDRIQNVTGAVSALALGFASGGPVGAGIAAVTIGIKALMDSFMAAELAAAKAAAAERAAMEETAKAAREAAAAARERASAMKSEDVRNAIRLENDALAEQLGLLDENLRLNREKRSEQEEIAKAQDNLTRARITEDEATGKITPEQAERQRNDISRAASKRGRDERKTRADEDAEIAAEKRKAAEEDSRKRDIAAAAAAGEEDAARKLVAEKAEEARIREAEVKAKRAVVDAGRPTQPMITGGGPGAAPQLSEAQIAEMQRVKEAQERYDRIEASLPDSEARLKATLPEKNSAEKALAEREKDRRMRADEAEKARRAAAEAAAAEQRAKDRAERTTQVVDTTGDLENQARDAEARARDVRAEREREAKLAADKERLRRNLESIPSENREDTADEERRVPGMVDKTFEGMRGSPKFLPVDKAKKSLEDGGTAEEYDRLAGELETFVDTIVNVGEKRKSEVSALAKTIRNLSERVRKIENK